MPSESLRGSPLSWLVAGMHPLEGAQVAPTGRVRGPFFLSF